MTWQRVISLAEDTAGGDEETCTPFTEKQMEHWSLLVERLASRALGVLQENTDPLLPADSASVNRRGESVDGCMPASSYSSSAGLLG